MQAKWYQDLFYCDIAVVPAKETPDGEREQMLTRIYNAVTSADWIFILELRKALAKGNWIAAQMNYHAFLNRHLVQLLNIKYRPAKADFGIRYADRDYPPEMVSELEDWLKVSSLEDIRTKAEQALSLYEKLKEELAQRFGGAKV